MYIIVSGLSDFKDGWVWIAFQWALGSNWISLLESELKLELQIAVAQCEPGRPLVLYIQLVGAGT